MKTHELLRIDSKELLSQSLNQMKTKEHEKHARKLARILKLDYERDLLKVSSIILDADSDDMLGEVFNHFFNEANKNYRDADQLLLSDSEELEVDSIKPKSIAEQHLKMRLERSRITAIFSSLLLIILSERTNLVQNRKAIKAEMEMIKATQQTTL